jgi:hypothetical protein
MAKHSLETVTRKSYPCPRSFCLTLRRNSSPRLSSSNPDEGYLTTTEHKNTENACKAATQGRGVDSDTEKNPASDLGNRLYGSIDIVGRHKEYGPLAPRRDVFESDGLQYTMITEVCGELHSSMWTGY